MDYLKVVLTSVQYKWLINKIDNLIVQELDCSTKVKRELNKYADMLGTSVWYVFNLYYTRLDMYKFNWTDFF